MHFADSFIHIIMTSVQGTGVPPKLVPIYAMFFYCFCFDERNEAKNFILTILVNGIANNVYAYFIQENCLICKHVWVLERS